MARARNTDGAAGSRRGALEALGAVDPRSAPLRLAWTDPATGRARSVRVPAGCAKLVIKLVREAAGRERGK